MNSQFHPHNIFKYCPKCGAKSLIQDTEKSQKCTECDFVFFTNSAGAVGVIIKNSNGEILLTTRAFNPGKGMLDLPGGFIDPGETAEECMEREVKEELNLDITDYTFIGTFPNQYVYKDILYFTIDMIFECNVRSFEHIVADDDVSGYGFYNINDEVIQKVGLQSIKKILADYCGK